MSIISSATQWLKTNIIGEGRRDFIDNSDAAKHQEDLDGIQRDLDRWRDGIDRVDQESKMHPPRLADVKPVDLVVGGAAAGAVVGAAGGMLNSVASTWLDESAVRVVENRQPVLEPTLKGYTDQMTPDVTRTPIYDGNGNVTSYRDDVKGNWHRFTPQIEKKEVGHVTIRNGEATHTVSAGGVLAEGLQGLVIGGAVGAGIGAAVAVSRRYVGGDDEQPAQPPREVDGQGKVIAAAAGVGAVAGAGLGLVNGFLEQVHAQTERVTTESPVMATRDIGQMPQDHYHSIFGVTRESDVAKVPVKVDAPVMERGLFGTRPQVTEQTVEVSSARFGIAEQVAAGAAIGAVTGVAAGVAINVARKYV